MTEDKAFVDTSSDDDWLYELRKQERLDEMSDDFFINVLTRGKGLPPDGLIEELKHGCA